MFVVAQCLPLPNLWRGRFCAEMVGLKWAGQESIRKVVGRYHWFQAVCTLLRPFALTPEICSPGPARCQRPTGVPHRLSWDLVHRFPTVNPSTPQRPLSCFDNTTPLSNVLYAMDVPIPHTNSVLSCPVGRHYNPGRSLSSATRLPRTTSQPSLTNI